VACGVSEKRYGVTSLSDLGVPVSLTDVDEILRREFESLFGLTTAQTVGKTSKKLPLAASERSVSVPSR
jgi:lipoyl(octanoyl) transferase